MSYSHRDSSLASSQYSTGFSDAASTSSGYTMTTQFTASTHGTYHQAATTGVLPCEFVGLAGCDLTFHLDDTDSWIEHIYTEHLREKLPSKSICWFCDNFVFDSKAHEFQNDRPFAFHCRMHHIREHIMDGKTVQDMRADFHMIQHLRRHGLITEEMYQIAIKWTDLPLSREEVKHVQAPHFVPSERLIEQERSNRVYIDQGKDDRQYKKSKGGRRK
ncbi:hypothetical protein F5Y04DRAFT_153172 [Hypomontagnella monticulosa]|nr:hypothetical protein F5Y04DRAFT_153172 [Hypomontagnella monticulosa]